MRGACPVDAADEQPSNGKGTLEILRSRGQETCHLRCGSLTSAASDGQLVAQDAPALCKRRNSSFGLLPQSDLDRPPPSFFFVGAAQTRTTLHICLFVLPRHEPHFTFASSPNLAPHLSPAPRLTRHHLADCRPAALGDADITLAPTAPWWSGGGMRGWPRASLAATAPAAWSH